MKHLLNEYDTTQEIELFQTVKNAGKILSKWKNYKNVNLTLIKITFYNKINKY